ncbi:MAG TPA: hypothetical protein VFU22_16545 [Roseiflexaceae bacterium]|nr:hypothetical protein [Roseiflexaceae bacterium]
MDRLKQRLDANLTALIRREPFFSETYRAARQLLNGARASTGGLMWPSGAQTGPHGCSCGDRSCLHQVGWRIYTGGRS